MTSNEQRRDHEKALEVASDVMARRRKAMPALSI